MIDTHAHFTKKYPYTLSVVSCQLQQAKEYGVKAIVSVMAEPEGYQCAYEAALNFPHIYLVLGIGRHLALKTTKVYWKLLTSYLDEQNPKVVAIGETGLDYRFKPNAYEISKQKEIFIHQIKLALHYDLPLVIHSGKAMDDVLDILEIEYTSGRGGVIHFFTGNLVQAQRAIEMGFYLSFALPILTNHEMQQVCKDIPLQWVLTETDSPFLKPPKGWPAQTSEPACVAEVVRKIAEVKEILFEEASMAIWKNAANLFKISDPI